MNKLSRTDNYTREGSNGKFMKLSSWRFTFPPIPSIYIKYNTLFNYFSTECSKTCRLNTPFLSNDCPHASQLNFFV